jgi:ABC transport system ATP-binding/permease protein
VLVSHDRYMLDRVSTIVIGLDGGAGGIFADYSQWEAFRSEPAIPGKTPVKESRLPAAYEPKRKLSYLEQREWDAMEAKILQAEQYLAECQRDMQAFASDANRVTEAYEKMQEAQRRVEDLYARWAQLEALVVSKVT